MTQKPCVPFLDCLISVEEKHKTAVFCLDGEGKKKGTEECRHSFAEVMVSGNYCRGAEPCAAGVRER